MNLLPQQGEVYYFPNNFTEDKSQQYFNLLLKEVNWKQEPIKIFGKLIMQPRLTAWYGAKDYSYSGITMRSRSFSGLLNELKDEAESVAHETFNSVLLNLYRDGQDSMGWHRDNEKELGLNPTIVSLSFGAGRKFKMRNYLDKSIVRELVLENGSLLLMQGETQHFWEHSLPKTTAMAGTRINLTFRHIK